MNEGVENKEEVVLPGSNLEVNSESYLSPDVEKAITKKHVGTVVLKESSEIKYPSYLIDLSTLDGVMACVMTALRGMLSPNGDGDTTIYVKLRTGIIEIGNGESYKLYKLLEIFINTVFMGKCKVYKNTDGKFRRHKAFDVSGIRLDL